MSTEKTQADQVQSVAMTIFRAVCQNSSSLMYGPMNSSCDYCGSKAGVLASSRDYIFLHMRAARSRLHISRTRRSLHGEFAEPRDAVLVPSTHDGVGVDRRTFRYRAETSATPASDVNYDQLLDMTPKTCGCQ